jgi:hypothetical protein
MQITVYMRNVAEPRVIANAGGWQLLGPFVLIGNDHAEPSPILMLRADDITRIEVEGTDTPQAEPDRIVKPVLAFGKNVH